MLDAVGPIYNTLYDVINNSTPGAQLNQFDRGFWYKEDCTQNLGMFPYGFLDQPETTPVVGVANPARYQYLVTVPLFIFTHAAAGDQSGLYFGSGLPGQPPGAIELLHEIVTDVWDRYSYGLPFGTTPIDWEVRGWTIGAILEPTTQKTRHILDNPYFAGAVTQLIFRITEDGPLPSVP